MNTEIICALIAGGASVLAALAERRSRQSAKRTEARAQRREKENRLSMELMYANCALSYVDFVRDEAARNISKV